MYIHSAKIGFITGMDSFKIREIQPGDKEEVGQVIRRVLIEMGVPKVGTAYEDKSLDDMHAFYDHGNMVYYIVEEHDKIIGCAGIAPLSGEPEICELQKMYFLPEARGRGIGEAMIRICLDFARSAGFQKCYLETMPYMENARKLYARTGFVPLEGPLGSTGHYNCSIWMIKDL